MSADRLNAATSNITNALSEGMNSKIQWIKRKACGYRNRERFPNATYFHLGGLDLYPAECGQPTGMAEAALIDLAPPAGLEPGARGFLKEPAD